MNPNRVADGTRGGGNASTVARNHRAVTPVITTGAAPACLRAAPSVSDMLLHPLAWLKRRAMLRRLEAHRRANYAANADYRKRSEASKAGWAKRDKRPLMADALVRTLISKTPTMTFAVRSDLREKLWTFGVRKCHFCQGQLQTKRADQADYATVEHIVPRCLGGSDNLSNVTLAHKTCNQRAGEPYRLLKLRVTKLLQQRGELPLSDGLVPVLKQAA